MEAKSQSGLGKDVSANKKGLAQVQDKKQPKQPKKGMALGMDIGTQFCFAGYVNKDDEFISLLPPSGEVAEYGIPTAMAIKVDDETIISGKNAIVTLIQNNSSEYREVSPSLKTLMRDNHINFIYLSDNTSKKVAIKTLATVFIQDLLRNLKYDNIKDAVINKIVVTYPNVAEDGEAYMNQIRSDIKDEVDNLLEDDEFQDKDKFAQDVKIVVVSEAKVAAKALKGKVGGDSFATIDVGGGTIDIAYIDNEVHTRSDDSWAIQENLDKMLLENNEINSSPFILANFKRKCFAQNWNVDLGLGKCKNCSEGNCNNKIDENGESGICNKITQICDMQKDKDKAESFAYIIRDKIKNAINGQALQSVVLLGGGSHMIFIQEALKDAFIDLGYNDIEYWTITPTNGKGYNVVYKQKGENINEKNITTANFLAYAAALYGESSEEEKERSSMLFTPIASYRPLVSSPPFTYVLAANHPTEEKTIYYMMPENFSNGDIYYLYPGLWNLKCTADFSEGVLCTVNCSYGEIIHEKVTIEGISLDATRQDDDHIGKVVAFVGPKHIEPGVYAVGVRYIGTMEEASDNNRLQLYLYKSQGEVDGKPCDPKSDATPYIAEKDMGELRASYKTDLTYDDFRKAAIKCEKSPT